MVKKGKFIVLEGLDGSGESTQASLLKEFLEANNEEVVLTKEPYVDSESGKKIRMVLEKKTQMGLKELQDLFTENRKEHLDTLIIPSLEKGITVISDRYYFSTFAFGGASGLDVEYLIAQNDKFLQPDLTFILDVNPETSLKRIEGRGKPKEFFEEIEKLTKTREFYQTFPERFANVYLIDGEKTIEKVFEQIKGRFTL
ncbi:dTMP kinase [Candidatus Giovannonibacteria bacterium RIFCSPLOWO2_01_FULL_46_13]|uniref:Thymidylate kinase n=1 Tax=Candidatus Giovannonibacteria bacterium RIFCSPLOWO2_01_FULL_46_13 TaxID=1798352 RepID=A0A1F5X3T2_9BACT|nr:MAG: dTMP kinase [Candidatus Giovannonibacteria bacterium RIFCSPLOWO2_01_FULL_46_13]